MVYVTSCLVASVGSIVGVKVILSPALKEFALTLRLTFVTGIFTVISTVADLSPAFAVIVAEPTFKPVTTPVLASTVATVVSLELHVTVG